MTGKDGVELESQYRRILKHLGKQHGLLGLVFRKAQNKIQDPAKLKRLISDLLDKERWMSWARGTASRRSDVDLLVMGLSDKRLLDAYDAVLEALQDCLLPIQPLVAGRGLLAKHGNSPFWRTVKAEAIPLLEGCLFPSAINGE